MSYCRFSSDDFQCDVYVYESVYDCFTIHVANSRVVFEEQLPPFISPVDDFDGYFKRHKEVMRIIEKSKREKIGLPFDGENFDLDSAKECAEKLIELKKIGYRVPQYAIDSLMD